MQIILAIDIGTTSICVLAMDAEQAGVLVSRSAGNDSNVSRLAPVRHEQNPAAMQRIVERLLEQVVGDLRDRQIPRDRIRAIAVTGQMHGVMMLDKHLQPVSNLVTWQDQRTLSGRESLLAPLANDTGNTTRCGCLLKPGYGGLTLHWLSRENDYAAMVRNGEIRIAGVADFVVAQLCGKLVTDPTMAASWGILDIDRLTWDAKRLDILEISSELLPQICESGAPVAALLPGYARRWALPDDVQVCTGLGDNQATVIASGPMPAGSCVINIGTGAQLSLVGAEFDYRHGLEIRPLARGAVIQVGSSPCGGWSYARLAEFFQSVVRQLTGMDTDLDSVLNQMNILAQNAARDTGGLTYSPVFSKENHSAAYQGINMGNLTPGNFSRATVNGIINELYNFYELAGCPELSRLFITGNAVKYNPLLTEIIAARWNVKPVLNELEEEAAIGVARLAAVNMSLMSNGFLPDRVPAEQVE